ncbi:alpha/beta hydrolase [Actinotalea sp. K2]|uniref:alpha/beta hydrolase family protein n=1 Tax=Actinotalea sp. K2 TaxID=2939438 RepID=UPI002016BE5A|nr:alpha/beta hydrolase [Actinotalea sp. K2]MCL3860105.1 alpha/beta hydrolase [Actinotalea sp. K2]
MRPPVLLALILLLLLAGCAPQEPAPDADVTSRPSVTPPTPGTGEFLAGLPATVDLPPGRPDTVIVLVPGGGWWSADPAGLAPLAEALVAQGHAVVTITYRAGGTGDSYPVPVDDVACGVAYAVDQVPGVPVVVVGHSAGAHLAALVGLAPDRPGAASCPHPPVRPDAVVGLAGPYDLAATAGAAQTLLGVPRDSAPELWREANPLTWADAHPEIPVLLVHGAEDDLVPASFSTVFADALTVGGHEVAVEVLPGVDHGQVILPEVVGDLLAGWVEQAVDLPPAP